MTENVCEMLSTLNGKHFTVLGKSIAFQKEPRTLSDTSSINLTKSATNLIPMRLSPRIKQLYLPVCLHEMKHEIANHYRDAKYKKATKTRAKVKRSAIAAALHRLRKRNRISKFATTAATASTAMHRQKMEHRRFILSQREVLQIPSFTFPRYECENKLCRLSGLQYHTIARLFPLKKNTTLLIFCDVLYAWRQINFYIIFIVTQTKGMKYRE